MEDVFKEKKDDRDEKRKKLVKKEVHPDHHTEPAKAPDEAVARLDKSRDDSEEKVKLSRKETNTEVTEEEVKLPKEEEDANTKDKGGREGSGKIKLHKTETSPENAMEDKKGKKEEFVKEKGTTKETGGGSAGEDPAILWKI